jgi:hypothetical protein
MPSKSSSTTNAVAPHAEHYQFGFNAKQSSTVQHAAAGGAGLPETACPELLMPALRGRHRIRAHPHLN